jgi:TorA maturation chaperone TorD
MQLVNPDVQECIRVAAELIRSEPAVRPCELAAGERSPQSLEADKLFRVLPDTEAGLNAEFEETFGLLVAAGAPPYESEYINGKFVFQRSQHLADVAGFYHAFGLLPSRTCPERPDHIALELEFMAAVIGLETGAASSSNDGQDELVDVCRHAQQRFVQEHLSWWVPAFARLLAREHRNGFYSAAGELLTSFLPAERTLLSVPLVHEEAVPTLLERPEECDGCVLQV